MPNKKISQIPSAGTLTGSEKIILTQSGNSVSTTLTQVIALVIDDDAAYVHLSGDTMTGTLYVPTLSATTIACDIVKIVGLSSYSGNTAAISGGLVVGSLYYTNSGGDGILKVVI